MGEQITYWLVVCVGHKGNGKLTMWVLGGKQEIVCGRGCRGK